MGGAGRKVIHGAAWRAVADWEGERERGSEGARAGSRASCEHSVGGCVGGGPL